MGAVKKVAKQVNKVNSLPVNGVMAGISGIAGKDSWVGRRAEAVRKSPDDYQKGMAGPGLGGIQQYQEFREASKTVAQQDMVKATQEAEAEIKSAEYAASASEGLARLAGKRRKNFRSTMIASGNGLGSSTVLG